MSYNNYETSYTSYGGGGGGGGGFIPGEGGGSQSSPSGGQRDFARDNIRPVTIKQMLEAQPSGDTFTIDSNSLSQVTFVAQIRNISTQTTNITYKVDDGTGSMEVKLWVDMDAGDPQRPGLTENAYCRVWGKLKSFNDRKNVVATIIRPIQDHNEISYHLLEATVVHLHFTRGPLGSNTGANGAANGAVQDTSGGGNTLAGYSQVAKKVYEYLRSALQSNEGLHQQEIASNLKIDTAQVAEAGDALLEGGLIYTTVDDQTWAVLDTD